MTCPSPSLRARTAIPRSPAGLARPRSRTASRWLDAVRPRRVRQRTAAALGLASGRAGPGARGGAPRPRAGPAVATDARADAPGAAPEPAAAPVAPGGRRRAGARLRRGTAPPRRRSAQLTLSRPARARAGGRSARSMSARRTNASRSASEAGPSCERPRHGRAQVAADRRRAPRAGSSTARDRRQVDRRDRAAAGQVLVELERAHRLGQRRCARAG